MHISNGAGVCGDGEDNERLVICRSPPNDFGVVLVSGDADSGCCLLAPDMAIPIQAGSKSRALELSLQARCRTREHATTQ